MRKFTKILAVSLILSLLISSSVFAAPRQEKRIYNQVSTDQAMDQSNQSDKTQDIGLEQQRQKLQEIAGSQIDPNAGQITELLPPPEGSTENPQIDQGIMGQTESEGELTQSADYDYVYLLGDVSDEQYATFSSYLTQVDEVLRTKFEDEGWQLILTSADLDDLLFQGQTSGVMGCTYFDQKVIYVNSGDYSYCVIHEMGHFLDYECGYESQTSDFQAIYEAEAANLTEYGQTSAAEFFAEVYQYQILENAETVSSCPNACSFVNSCLASLSSS